ILESSGSGVTVWDYDGDGDEDIYLLNGAYIDGISDISGAHNTNASDALYRNNNDGTFTDVTHDAGLNDTHWSMAACPADLDGDGDPDLLLLNYGPNVVYRNNGNGTFTDITSGSGFEAPDSLNGFPKWSVSAFSWDENDDGALDIMVGNFLAFDPQYHTPGKPDEMPFPSEYKGQASFLYRQIAPGKFQDVTNELGLYYPDSKCMGLSVFDFGAGGAMDILQANDHQPNFLFRKMESGIFQETGLASGIALNDEGVPTGSMHPSIGDVDGDGLIDILVSDLEHGALYRNKGNGLFEDITMRSGLSALWNGLGAWSALLFDADNDGDLDLFSANGRAEVLEDQYPSLFFNDGSGHFSDMAKDGGDYFLQKHSGRGAALVDYDNDGRMDIIVSHVDLHSQAALLHNRCDNGHHWLGLILQKADGTPAWPGAKIKIHAGEKTQVLADQPGNAYLSYNDPRIHAGLGSSPEADLVEIDWPDGRHERFEHLKADQYLKLREGSGEK
ncbi:MAG TPA: CRTAC1 family protein, partial [Saprospiraceae bacterium]|nr:CRTAC1 family protein [Saprospiraceae bacterium]